ncbi:MAG: DUF881 domain-containing protein [Nocardioidaceae bacterium]
MSEPVTTERPIPIQAQMGLLNYLTAFSLDEDYATVSAKRPASHRLGRGGLVVLVLFGLLVAMAGVQTARSAGEAASSHDSLVRQVLEGKTVLQASRQRVATLERQIETAQIANRASGSALAAASQRATQLGADAGSSAVRGPGVRIVVNDAEGASSDAQRVLDTDLRNISNGLWQAGAEAIAINGQRLTSLSAIRVAGSYPTVNYVTVYPPYTITAIGNPDTLGARFVNTTTGLAFLSAKDTVGLRYSMRNANRLQLPAVAQSTLQLRHAEAVPVSGKPNEREGEK